MKKAAAKRGMTTTIPQDQIDRSLAVFAARKQFLAAATNMGWQLALTVLLPVIIGVKLDDHYHTSPSYTLAALVLATGGAIAIVWNTVKRLNVEQASTHREKHS